jgi:hypothetical protein
MAGGSSFECTVNELENCRVMYEAEANEYGDVAAMSLGLDYCLHKSGFIIKANRLAMKLLGFMVPIILSLKGHHMPP